MDWLLKASDAIGRVVAPIGKAGAWFILPLTFIMVFDVLARKIHPLQILVNDTALKDYLQSTKLQEMEWHLHGIVLLLAFGFTYVCDRHIRIDGWRQNRTPRTQALIEIVGILFALLPFAGLMLYEAIQYTQMAYASNETSPQMTGLPYRWIIKSFMIAAYGLLIAAGLAVLMRAIYFFCRPGQRRPPLRVVVLAEPALPVTTPEEGVSVVTPT